MSSPFKNGRPERPEDPEQDSQSNCFFVQQVHDLWPDPSIEVPKTASPVKAKQAPIWSKDTVSIYDHLFDMKVHLEDVTRIGHIRSPAEHFSVLRASVQIPATRDWLKELFKDSSTAPKTPADLMLALLVEYHDSFDESRALDLLMELPNSFSSVAELNPAFEKYSSRVSARFLTDQLRAHMYVSRVPTAVRTAGQLDHLLQQGWKYHAIKAEATRLGGQSVPVARHVVLDTAPPVVRVRTPTPEPARVAPEPEGMDLDTIKLQQAFVQALKSFGASNSGASGSGSGARGGAGGRGGKPSRGRGGAGSGGRGGSSSSKEVTCYKCGGINHYAWACTKN